MNRLGFGFEVSGFVKRVPAPPGTVENENKRTTALAPFPSTPLPSTLLTLRLTLSVPEPVEGREAEHRRGLGDGERSRTVGERVTAEGGRVSGPLVHFGNSGRQSRFARTDVFTQTPSPPSGVIMWSREAAVEWQPEGWTQPPKTL